MIVLDTNVLSELMRPRPAACVMRWVDRLPAGEIAVTAVTAAELMHGVERLDGGARRRELAGTVGALLGDDLEGRILGFDGDAAGAYALLVAERERRGRPIGIADAQIAAICLTRGAMLATRNVRDFEATGVTVLDPWTVASQV